MLKLDIKSFNTNKSGFTLIELGIVLALLAILIAVMVPNVNSYILKTRVSRAQKECRTIADAIIRMNGDTRMWPYTTGPVDGDTRTIDKLFTDMATCPTLGDNGPECVGDNCDLWYCGGNEADLMAYLDYNNPDGDGTPGDADDYNTDPQYRFRWKGPYLGLMTGPGSEPVVDPWGHSYIVNARYFPEHSTGQTGHNVIVFSRGPDGEINTQSDDDAGNEQAGGDDIVHVILTTAAP